MARWRARSPRRRSAASNRPTTAGDFRKLLGRKLSLRYALPDDSGYSSTEAVGVLMDVTDDDRIAILDRRGNVHDVAIKLIEAAKVFPA